MVNLAREFHNFPPGSLKSVTLPTVGPYITSGAPMCCCRPLPLTMW